MKIPIRDIPETLYRVLRDSSAFWRDDKKNKYQVEVQKEIHETFMVAVMDGAEDVSCVILEPQKKGYREVVGLWALNSEAAATQGISGADSDKQR